MRWATAALVVLTLAASGLAVLGVRLSRVQETAMDEGLKALSEGRDARAIAGFRRVVRAHHPLADRTEAALEKLLELGASLEERGDPEMARLAYLSAWGGMNASTAFGASVHPLALEARERLVKLRDGRPFPRHEATARPVGKAAAALGMVLFVGSGFSLLRGRPSRAERPAFRRILVELSLFFAGLALFVVGALHA
jgi:hypothetical protein